MNDSRPRWPSAMSGCSALRVIEGCLRVALLAVVALGATRSEAPAACAVIPGTTILYPGTLGSLDRPFATPGSFVEMALDPVCRGASPGFSLDASDHVVTVVFEPPGGDPQRRRPDHELC